MVLAGCGLKKELSSDRKRQPVETRLVVSRSGSPVIEGLWGYPKDQRIQKVLGHVPCPGSSK